MENYEPLWESNKVNWGLKKIVKDESEDLVDVLSPDNEWVDSKNLDVNNFSALWKWVDTEFIINESNIHQSENGYLYIVVDGIKYFNKWDYQHRYMKIFDEYWMPYFYIWEVRPGELIDECKCIVIRNDGWIFKGEWNKKWVLKSPNNVEYDWSFVDGKPIDLHSKPEFRKKWIYTKPDWTKETYVAYSCKMRPQFISWKDRKEKENWSKKRGSVVSVKTEHPTWEIEYVLHSRKRDTSYYEDENSYIFESPNWKKICLPKKCEEGIDGRYWIAWELRKWSDRAKQLANMINAIEKFVCLHPVSKFSSFWPHLQVKYWDMLLRKTLLKNVEKRLWVQVKDLTERLNDCYVKSA